MALATNSFLLKLRPAAIAAIAGVFGFIASNPKALGLCFYEGATYYCRWGGTLVDAVGDTLLYTSIAVLPAALISIFLPGRVRSLWLGVSYPLIVAMALIIVATPEREIGGMIFSYPARLYIAIFLGIVYTLTSISLMTWKTLSLRKRQPK